MVGLVRRAVWSVTAGFTFTVLLVVDVATGQLVRFARDPGLPVE